MSETGIVEYFSAHENYKCGYCKSEDTCYSFGLWGHALTPVDYQCLIDRGWRRSGKYCYKPTMHLTCCPQYTIRCEAMNFTLSRSQKKVLKKVRRFLATGEREQCTSRLLEINDQAMDMSDIPEPMDIEILKNIRKVSQVSQSDFETSDLESPNDADGNAALLKRDKDNLKSSPSAKPCTSNSSHANSFTSHLVSPAKSSSVKPCRKAKEIRRERKLQKLLSKGILYEEALLSIQKKAPDPKTLENFLYEPFHGKTIYKLELRLVPSSVGNPLFTETFEESYSLYTKYQMAIHKDPPEKCTEHQFVRFLVKNPFQRLDGVSSSEIGSYGSFHQQYWLNDKLIAVGVIDILRYCVSSVYFYYDPDYNFLSLGTYAALREIDFTQQLNKRFPDIQYYYMGYYIHSCVKMKYKGQYHPSYLLCPETYTFHPLEKCKPKLDRAKYHRLEDDPNKGDSDGIVNLHEVQILYIHKRMSYQSYIKMKKQANDEDEVREYAGFVGRKCYRRMLLFRS